MSDLDEKLRAEFDKAWGRALDASMDDDFKKEDGELDEGAYITYQDNARKLHSEAVKQAFIGDGWLSPEGCKDVQNKLNTYAQLNEAVTKYLLAGGDQDFIVMSRTDWERNAKLAGVMTGQEWYDRLAEQLKKYDWTADERDSILQAAFEISHEG